MSFWRGFFSRNNLVSGFTLLEVMVVIGITLVLSGVVLTYNRKSESQLVIYREQSLITGMLNRAKTLTLQKFRSPDELYDTCAFGVRFDAPRTLVLFQDLGKGGCKGNNPQEIADRYRLGPLDRPEVLETHVLSEALIFKGLPSTGFDLAFVPPDLYVTSSVSNFPIRFTIETLDGEYKTGVAISSVGQITTY